jgi:hypothetical protein
MSDVMMLKRCEICAEAAYFSGPLSLAVTAIVFCGTTCARIWDAITPGEWIDASEMMPGGRIHDRPDIWYR